MDQESCKESLLQSDHVCQTCSRKNIVFPLTLILILKYDRAIDDFLFRDVGYDILNQICVNIFPSSYAVTSISEYWAKGFEELFIGDRDTLKQMCPILFNTLALMLKELENEN